MCKKCSKFSLFFRGYLRSFYRFHNIADFFNPSGAEIAIYWSNWVSMIVDDFPAPYVTRPSAAMTLTVCNVDILIALGVNFNSLTLYIHLYIAFHIIPQNLYSVAEWREMQIHFSVFAFFFKFSTTRINVSLSPNLFRYSWVMTRGYGHILTHLHVMVGRCSIRVRWDAFSEIYGNITKFYYSQATKHGQFLKENIQNRHPIACPWGQDMGCLLRDQMWSLS